jgi:cytochrome c
MKHVLNSGTGLRRLIMATALAFALNPAAVLAVDESAAEELAKAGKCFRCHSVDKAKKAPSYKRIAAKYKGKADAEATMLKHLSGNKIVKVEDGGDEDHDPPPAKDAADLKNLVQWILSRG